MQKGPSVATSQKYPRNYFEKAAWQNKFYVCGIDEVGRGCLAGPLVVAACILPQNTKYILKDSKVLTEAEREKNYLWLVKNSWHSIAIINPEIIDKINIYNATLLAMKRAFVQLVEVIPFEYELLKFLVIDAMPLTLDQSHKNNQLEVHHFPYGESISSSIAGASIIAKVTRDRLMKEIDPIFPGFGLAQHKGYGTKEHMENIKTKGTCIIHRKSFISKIETPEDIFKNGNDTKSQQSIF
ncbi:MAG: Ribonuclease HII [candidate division TM6 bacterium GW2011_GWF2_36_6]|jgi:ribonuclease HII|nr:MAG: Ribonuclease HII [candidate division TM6 bacterium GW2011_GWF2_36_6]